MSHPQLWRASSFPILFANANSFSREWLSHDKNVYNLLQEILSLWTWDTSEHEARQYWETALRRSEGMSNGCNPKCLMKRDHSEMCHCIEPAAYHIHMEFTEGIVTKGYGRYTPRSDPHGVLFLELQNTTTESVHQGDTRIGIVGSFPVNTLIQYPCSVFCAFDFQRSPTKTIQDSSNRCDDCICCMTESAISSRLIILLGTVRTAQLVRCAYWIEYSYQIDRKWIATS